MGADNEELGLATSIRRCGDGRGIKNGRILLRCKSADKNDERELMRRARERAASMRARPWWVWAPL